MGTHLAREHPDVEVIPKMTDRDLWAYVLGEVDFLSTPEQKRLTMALDAALHELHRRFTSRRRRR